MNSKIFVIGGWNGNRGLTRCDMYDPAVGKWFQTGHLHTGRYQTGVCMLNDVIYAIGGKMSKNIYLFSLFYNFTFHIIEYYRLRFMVLFKQCGSLQQ